MCPKCARQHGILSPDMFCDNCTQLLPLCKFTSELQAAWKDDTVCRFVCVKCSGTKRAQGEKHCDGCNRSWRISAFDDVELRDAPDGAELPAQCIRCKAQAAGNSKLDGQHKCHTCSQAKPWSSYSPIVLKVVLCEGNARGGPSVSRKLVCEACQYPRCAGAACPAGNPISMEVPSHSAYDENRRWFCQACRTLRCSVCEHNKEKHEFSEKMCRKKYDDKTRICMECTSPQCTNPQCKTCKKCRDPACKKTQACNGKKMKLNQTLMPKTKADLEAFLCSSCAFLCTICGRRGQEYFSLWMKKTGMASKRRCKACTKAVVPSST